MAHLYIYSYDADGDLTQALSVSFIYCSTVSAETRLTCLTNSGNSRLLLLIIPESGGVGWLSEPKYEVENGYEFLTFTISSHRKEQYNVI